jgi:WD40 repeat protein
VFGFLHRYTFSDYRVSLKRNPQYGSMHPNMCYQIIRILWDMWHGHWMIPYFSQAPSILSSYGIPRYVYNLHVCPAASDGYGTQTGECIRVLDGHSETVTAVAWLPDGSGFISGGLDRKIILWVCALFIANYNSCSLSSTGRRRQNARLLAYHSHAYNRFGDYTRSVPSSRRRDESSTTCIFRD